MTGVEPLALCVHAYSLEGNRESGGVIECAAKVKVETPSATHSRLHAMRQESRHPEDISDAGKGARLRAEAADGLDKPSAQPSLAGEAAEHAVKTCESRLPCPR